MLHKLLLVTKISNFVIIISPCPYILDIIPVYFNLRQKKNLKFQPVNEKSIFLIMYMVSMPHEWAKPAFQH